MRDNLETLYGAIGDCAIAVRIPTHARKELREYLQANAHTHGLIDVLDGTGHLVFDDALIHLRIE